MPNLDQLHFLEVDLNDGYYRPISPDQPIDVTGEHRNRQLAENAVETVYEALGLRVRNVHHLRKSPIRHALGEGALHRKHPETRPDIPRELPEAIRRTIRSNESSPPEGDSLDLIDRNGIPDLLIFDPNEPENYHFTEVKFESERLLASQVTWFDRFDYFDIRVVIVFSGKEQLERYRSGFDIEELLSNVATRSRFKEIDNREPMSAGEIAQLLETVETSDELLFNERKEPLSVVAIDETMTGKATLTGVKLKSQGGKEYLLSNDGTYYLDPWNKRDLKWVGYP